MGVASRQKQDSVDQGTIDMAQHIQLSLHPDVVPNWGIWEAIREILQGAIDSGTSYDMTYDADRQTIRIVNDGKAKAVRTANFTEWHNGRTMGNCAAT